MSAGYKYIERIATEVVAIHKYITQIPAFPLEDNTANDILTWNNDLTRWTNILSDSIQIPSLNYTYSIFQQHITNRHELCLPVKSFPIRYKCSPLLNLIQQDMKTYCDTDWNKEKRIKYKYVTADHLHTKAKSKGRVIIDNEDLFLNHDLDSEVARKQFNIYQSTYPAVFIQKGGSVSLFHVDAVHGASYLHSGRKLWLCLPFDIAKKYIVHDSQLMVQLYPLDLSVLEACKSELQWFIQEAGETVLVNPWCCHAVITFADPVPAILVSNNHVWRSAFQLTVEFNRVFLEPDFTPGLRKRTADTMQNNDGDPLLIQEWITRKKSQYDTWLQ